MPDPGDPEAGDSLAAVPADADATDLARLLLLGDFGLARRKARALLAGSATEPARAAAHDALDRTNVDPLAIALLAACVAIFVVVVALTVK